MIRLVIVDDHPIVREGLRAILQTADDIDLVGEASGGAEAVSLCEDLEPDVVLMDLRMPEVNGIEAIRRIKMSRPSIEVVILTTYEDDNDILDGLKAGARGYLLKDTEREVLFDTIRAAARGELLLPPKIAERVVASLKRPDGGLPAALTDRELEVLSLIADGAANKQIAARLGITERTVKAHAAGIFGKLSVNSRAEAVAVALRRGLLSR